MLRKHGRDILDTAVTVILSLIALVASFRFGMSFGGRDTAFWKSLLTVPEPEQCALCGGTRYHAPALVHLSTGAGVELQVYVSDPEQPGELSPHQPTNFYSFQQKDGILAWTNRGVSVCRANLPQDEAPITPACFCRDCRALLAKCATKGYILADLYDLDSIQVYPIIPGQEYTIRDYTVLIGQRENAGGVSITVQGHLFDGGE